MTDDGRATRWLRAEYEGPSFGGLRIVPKIIGAVVRVFSFDGPDIAADCRVVIRRRDNGVEVAEFDYDRVGEAQQHLADLRDRLTRMGLFEFTRDAGIGFDKVADARPCDSD